MVDYDAHSWREHLLDIRGSMVREILYRVLSCVLFAAVVVYVDRRHLPLGVSEKAHGLVSVALGLLLVFRTNASYDRFWEGRKLWGTIVNASRNLVRAASVHLRDEPVLLERIVRRAIAFPWACMHRLRDAPDAATALGRQGTPLPAGDLATLAGSNHVPLALAARITEDLREARDRGRLSDYLLGVVDQNVQILIDCIGGCERIHRTPLPFAYVVHLRRALILYCFSLPFILVQIFGWWTIFITLLVSYILLGIEEIGVEISDPFGEDDNDLPLEAICQTIEDNLRPYLPDQGPERAL